MHELALRRGARPGRRRPQHASPTRAITGAPRSWTTPTQPIGGLGGRRDVRARCNVPACNIGAPGGTAQSHRLIATTAPVADRLRRRDRRRVPDQLRRLPAGHDGRLRRQGHAPGQLSARRHRSAARCSARAGTSRATRSPTPLRTTRASARRARRAGPLTATDERRCDFTYRVPVQQRGRSCARVPRHAAGRAVPAHPDRHRRREEPAERQRERRNRRHAPVGRPAPAARSHPDPQGRRRRVRVRRRADLGAQHARPSPSVRSRRRYRTGALRATPRPRQPAQGRHRRDDARQRGQRGDRASPRGSASPA